ncbi:MAG: sigma-70 family RNA polymerase sigma factor [Saprospiraceae bacterium]|nr:sigma-70 family RNA polymerase sigma factor [Saprospiraceae bacterium]
MSLRWLKPKKGLANWSDEQLLRAFQKTKEDQYFFALIERYSHLIYYNCKQYLSQEEDCKDMLMIIVEKVYERCPDANINYFRSWLYSVIRNQCISHIRAQNRQSKNNLDWEEAGSSVAGSATVQEGSQTYGYSDEAIEAALQELDPYQRQCLQLFYFEDKSYKEISQQTSLSLKKVKSYLQNGKRRLKILLEGIQQDKS